MKSIDLNNGSLTCTICGDTKSRLLFVRSHHYKGGFRTRCLDCNLRRVTEYTKANKEKVRQQQFRSRDAYPERVMLKKLRKKKKSPILSREELKQLLDATPVCPCCTMPLDPREDHSGQYRHSGRPNKASLVLLDPRETYVRYNVMLLCLACHKAYRKLIPAAVLAVARELQARGVK